MPLENAKMNKIMLVGTLVTSFLNRFIKLIIKCTFVNVWKPEFFNKDSIRSIHAPLRCEKTTASVSPRDLIPYNLISNLG
jgi:hypothetical protein